MSAAPVAGYLIRHRLFGSDVRMLACRVYPDLSVPSCGKVLVEFNDTAGWLCERRVKAFLSDATSLAGITCVDDLPDPPLADGDLP